MFRLFFENIELWSVSSVGSERFLHTEEVDSSNLPQTTEKPQLRGFFNVRLFV